MESVSCDTGKKATQKSIISTTSHKAALLSQAPVVPFDTDLYEWENPNSLPNEMQSVIPSLQLPCVLMVLPCRFESLHKFWAGAKETEVVISEVCVVIMMV